MRSLITKAAKGQIIMLNRNRLANVFWLAPCMAALAAAAIARAEPPAPKLQTIHLGEWYTVTCPEVLRIGSEAEIKVAYRGITRKDDALL